MTPRQGRIDAPGALHHVMIRGIERATIFVDDEDRASFLERMEEILEGGSTPCYAWSLSNHAHFLLRTGKTPISNVMRNLLTGYAVTFNKRHRRHGHLFQNRYKSILCEEETYLQELVRYIRLNPLRARTCERSQGARVLPLLRSLRTSGQEEVSLAGQRPHPRPFWEAGEGVEETVLGITPSGVSRAIVRAQRELQQEMVGLLENQ